MLRDSDRITGVPLHLGASLPLKPGSYLAIVDRSPEVVLGVSSAREEASLHVVLGKW